jgi:1-acyl-sn-glycerol-3-phosphate acyltransferase
MVHADVLAGGVRIITGARGLPHSAVPSGPCIFFANHSSHLDFAVIWSVLPSPQRARTRPVAGRDYWGKTAFRRWLAGRVFRAVLIERQKVTVACNPMQEMLDAIDAGASLIVFPEGTRSADGNLHPFKSGLYHLARARPQLPLVPVYLNNLNRVLPKGEWLMVPLIVNVSVGSALQLDEGEAKPAFLERARAAVAALCPR